MLVCLLDIKNWHLQEFKSNCGQKWQKWLLVNYDHLKYFENQTQVLVTVVTVVTVTTVAIVPRLVRGVKVSIGNMSN